MPEKLKMIKGFKGYFISNLGIAYSNWSGELVKLKTDKSNGYAKIRIGKRLKNRNQSMFYVHRLVLLTFVGKPKNRKMQCCHKDGNKLNNKLSNLRWGTVADNTEDNIRNNVYLKGQDHRMSKLNDLQVRVIRRCFDLGSDFLANVFSVKRHTISDIKYGKNWKHLKGYKKSKVKPQPIIRFRKLNSLQVRIILRNVDLSVTFLAEIFNVSKSAISYLRKRNSYKI